MTSTAQTVAGDNLLISWGGELEELDAQIKALQDGKRDFYGAIRDSHGKTTADALKAAQRIRNMDAEKRAKADEVDSETARILAVLDKPRAPRATRSKDHANSQAKLVETVSQAVQTDVGKAALLAAIDIMIEREEAETEFDGESHERTSRLAGECPEAPPMERPREGPSETVAPDFEPPAFLMKREQPPLRPHCLQPDLCGGVGREHCYTCKKAMAEQAA